MNLLVKNLIKLPDEESYASNCFMINQNLIVSEGFPQIEIRVEKWDINVSFFIIMI